MLLTRDATNEALAAHLVEHHAALAPLTDSRSRRTPTTVKNLLMQVEHSQELEVYFEISEGLYGDY